MSATQQTLKDFIETHQLSMSTAHVASNPGMADDEWTRTASHYLCTIRSQDGREPMNVHFSMGSGLSGEPTLPMVLNDLASDAASVRNAADWIEWADEMGMLDDGANAVRQAQATFDLMERQTSELETFLGADALQALMYETEQL